MKTPILLFFCSLIIWSACDIYPQDEYQEYYVVETYLVAGQSLPMIRVSRTLPADQVYSLSDAAVTNSSVQVALLEGDEASTIEEVYPYSWDRAGEYQPLVSHNVLPSRTYRLNVTIPEASQAITAYTRVPGDFQILGGIPDSIVYQSSEQLEINVTRSAYPGRQTVYIFNTLAGEVAFENLTPLYADFYDDEEDLELFANTSSGLINEGNFTINEDNTITIQYPWLAAAYFGDNTIVVNAVDDNIYDFVRSSSVQLGGSTLSPGEIQNAIYNIEGAIGVFGSMATDSVQTRFLRPSN